MKLERATQSRWLLLLAGFVAALSPLGCSEEEVVPEVPAPPPYQQTEAREACDDYQPLRRPLFGDTHVHTAFSMDASLQDTRNTPRDAYRFAKGEAVGLQPYDADGRPQRRIQLERSLDWTALSDHAEMLGEIRICGDPSLEGYDSDICWNKRALGPRDMAGFLIRTMVAKERFAFCGPDGALCRAAAKSAWQEIQQAAEAAYDRSAACSFTSLVGYEWTAAADGGLANLHRNVLFRNAEVPQYPMSSVDARSAHDLFESLERDCAGAPGNCEALVIPHNSNISKDGLIFATSKLVDSSDAALAVDRAEAELRNRYERVVEIMQHKGDSECLISGDTTDEACGFEKVPYDNMGGAASLAGAPTDPKPRAFVRDALKQGLVQAAALGVNPLKYGIIASTDSHLGTPGLAMEDKPMGHGGAGKSMAYTIPPGLPDNIEFNPGGLAVVWAEENTRDSIYSALARRETYGTSGTRPVVRFFGGWGYDAALCGADDFAAEGYAGGVPMGGDLPPRPAEAGAPVFAVSASRDPGAGSAAGSPLQRIQIIKGWVENGATHERVFDVAGGENGAGVDLRTCQPHGRGASQLCSVWSDPDFDPAEPAFYYVRVLENPTCRWHQHLCSAAGVDCARPETVTAGYAACCDDAFPKTVQERAWTSPIFHQP